MQQTLLIVGGSRGIGKALAYQLSETYNIIITGKKLDNLIKVCSEASQKIDYIQYDLSHPENISSLYEQALAKSSNGKINNIIYSAAIHSIKPVRKFDYNLNLEMFNINFFSFVELAKLFAQQKFTAESKGRIIAISTMETQLMSSGMSLYTASKSALEAFCITMAREYVKRNILVNGIRPAFVNTDMASNSLEIMPELSERYPLGILSSDDIVNPVRFLLSDSAKNITGKFLDINSGYFVK